MSITMSISKRAIKITTALALVAVMSVIAASLLMTGAGGATAINSDASDTARHMPIPAQYTEQCSNGIAVQNPADNPGLVADCAALLASKDTLEGSGTNVRRLNWLPDIPISDWDGIATANNRVSGLGLSADNSNGAVSTDYFLDLGASKLYSNQLTGTIPAELGNLTNLKTLDLSNNQLTGAIPPELGNLANLTRLDLNHNYLTGAIPSELGNLANLRDLRLRFNALTGEIPADLGNLSNLWSLCLYGNRFRCIPASLRARFGGSSIEGLPYCDATSVATPTPTATPAASSEVLNRLTALETQVAEIPAMKNQIATMATSIARLEGASAIAPLTPTPTATPSPTPSATPVTAPGATPSPTATSVAGTSGNNACITELAGSATLTGNWTSDCLSANPSDNRTYYARFYTFTLSAPSETTITLSSNDAAPYLFLREGAGTSGAVIQENGAANATTAAITATLQPGAYTIEASTWNAETPGAFTLALEITR